MPNSEIDKTQAAIGKAGATPLLVSLAKSHPTAEGRYEAMRTLQRIAKGVKSNKQAIYDAGGVEMIVASLKNAPESDAIQKAMCAKAMWDLCGRMPCNRKVIIEAGALPHLLQMLQRKEVSCPLNAVGCLAALAGDDAGIKHLIAAGAITAIEKLAASTRHESTKKHAERALERLHQTQTQTSEAKATEESEVAAEKLISDLRSKHSEDELIVQLVSTLTPAKCMLQARSRSSQPTRARRQAQRLARHGRPSARPAPSPCWYRWPNPTQPQRADTRRCGPCSA